MTPIRLSGAAHEAGRIAAAPPGKAVGPGWLLPVSRLLQPPCYGSASRMAVVVVDHLLLNVVVADAPPVGDVVVIPVANDGNDAVARPYSLPPMRRTTAKRWLWPLSAQQASAHATLPRTHCAQRQAAQREMPVGEWRRAQVAQGESAWQTGEREEEGGEGQGQDRERGRSGSHAVSQRAGGNRAARERVRPAAVVGEQDRGSLRANCC